MQTYGAACTARVVQRLVGPRAVSANTLAATVGVSQETRSRWLRQARSVEGMSAPKLRAATRRASQRCLLQSGDLGSPLRAHSI